MMQTNPTLQAILDRLQNVKQTSEGYSGRCPAHDDQNNSLSVTVGEDGRVLVYCHAGCTNGAVCEAIGLRLKDLFPPKAESPHRRTVAEYDYTDEDGNLLFQKVRYEPKDFRCRVPDGSGGWNWKMAGVRRVLYHLPAVVKSGILYICEGEKDCDCLGQPGYGYIATCNFDGAGKWDDAYTPYFKGKLVYILPDNDTPGKKHAAAVYQAIKAVAADCRIVELPGLKESQDVSDYFQNGGTIEAFNQLCLDAPEGVPESFEGIKEKPDSKQPAAGGDWWPVVPFDDMDRPEFPLSTVPSCLSGFARIVREVSASHQTPADMTALLLVTIAAACLGGKVKVVTNNRYTELATLYTAVFCPSGTRKSSVYGALMKPVIDYQRRLRAEMRAEIEGNKNELDILKKQIEKLKKDIVRSGSDEAAALWDELHEKEQILSEFAKPVELPLIYMETDFTVESLAPKIEANGGTFALFDHEGAFWDEVAGRYKKGQSQTNDLILKSYDGHTFTMARVGRGDISIEHCNLAIGLIVQPTKIEDLKDKKILDETGLIPRFVLSAPADNIGYREVETAAVPMIVYDDYNRRIEALFGLRQYPEIVLEIDGEATEQFRQYCRDIEVRLREGRDLYPLRAWASKLTGRIARIAAVLHCYAYPDTVPDCPRIDAGIMDYAIGLSEYLIAHAKATYQILNLSADVKIARKILRSLEKYAASADSLRISKSEIWSRIKNSDKTIQTVSSIAGALDILIDHNTIRQVDTERKPGRPAEIYELNPACFSTP